MTPAAAEILERWDETDELEVNRNFLDPSIGETTIAVYAHRKAMFWAWANVMQRGTQEERTEIAKFLCALTVNKDRQGRTVWR